MLALRTKLEWPIVACLFLCALLVACNDTDDVHVGLRSTRYQCAGAPLTRATPQAPSPVALACGIEVDVDERELNLVILGATTSADINGLRFDVVYPRDRFAYVAGSVSMVTDNFLTWGGGVCVANVCTAPPQSVGKACANNNKTCNAPGEVVPVLTASETLDPPADPMMPNLVQARLRIAIDRPAGAGEVAATLGGTTQVLRFRLRATSLTEPIDPTLLKFENKAAVDDAGVTITSIVFTDQLFLWVQ
jgi:hypothetical protein